MKILCKICGKNIEVQKVVLPYADDKRKKMAYVYYKCCNYLKQSKFLTNQESNKLYSSNYSCYQKNSVKNIVNYIFTTYRAYKYRNFILNKNVLELGCGMGDFILGTRRYKPKSVEGVEMSKFACDFINQRGKDITIYNEDIETFSNNKKYDSIFMFHVIEHVKDPKVLIEKCFKILKRGGILVLETPNLVSWDRHIFGNKWFNYQVPYHTHIFSKYSLDNMGKSIGFITKDYNYMKFPNTLSVQFNIITGALRVFLPIVWSLYILEYFFSSVFKASSVIGVTMMKK